MTKPAPLLALIAVAIASPSFAQAPASPASTTEPAPPADPDQRIKCRSISITGSLARSEKVCKTVGEWRRLRERGSEAARDIVDYSRTKPGGQ